MPKKQGVAFAREYFLLILGSLLRPFSFKFMSQIADKVKSIIVDKLGVDPKDVTMEASFANDLGADSLDTVELIMEFEKEFSLSIPDEAAEKIATVGDAVAYLESNSKK
jgi:acyl carrier protein